MKREDEEFCRVQFDTFLKRLYPPTQVTWQEVAQEHEPPDYYLRLGETCFAVEVTTVVEQVSVGPASQLPHFVIRELLWSLVREVERCAKQDGCLQGKYLVVFTQPIDDLRNVRKGIRERLLDYVRRTRQLETAPCETVFERSVSQEPPQRCTIQKLAGQPDRIDRGGPFWAKWEGEATEDLCGLLEGILFDKARKLREVGEPKILLLLDEFRFADRQMFEYCAHRLSSLSDFHSVFVVHGQGPGFLVHSCSRDWSEASH